MKFISVIYMSRRNFWCMTRGDSSHLNFQLQKVDWEPSGRQNQGKMMEFWKIFYIHFIRDPKGITYIRFILKIASDAKMRLANALSSYFFNFFQFLPISEISIFGLGPKVIFQTIDFWENSFTTAVSNAKRLHLACGY